MKLILAIINLDDVAGVIKHLTKSGFSSTKLTSSGGLLKEGNVTIMTGVSEDRLEEALALINKYYDLAQLGDKLAKEHYLTLEKTAGDCIGCGHCDSRFPFHVAQSERMQSIRAYFGA